MDDTFPWRWSTDLQVTSIVIIAAFFAALSRSTRRDELRWWVGAWTANLVALLVTIAFADVEGPAWAQAALESAYLWGKTAFLWMFVQGAWSLVHPGTRAFHPRYALLTITAFALGAGALLWGTDLVEVWQHMVIAVLLGYAAVFLFRARDVSLNWLAAGLTLRAILAIAEAAAYALRAFSPAWADGLSSMTETFLPLHPSLDTAAEWPLAFGAILAVWERAQRELRSFNQELLDVQEDLRRLVDRDPLTALANRRALPEILRSVQPKGATLLFFDLDQFKAINDLHGHHAGDECLQRFALALLESFRPDDAVVRVGGDEFLVVATGLTAAGCAERVALVTERLERASRKQGPLVSFSVGLAELAPGGQPDLALEAADLAMYRQKAARRDRASHVMAPVNLRAPSSRPP
jgi:diguanylate cyclase (GGDEF)-like protein